MANKNQKTNVTSYAAITGKNAKTVDQLIASAISSVKSMRERVQVASIAVLMHAEKTGDYRKAQDLIDGLGNGVNQTALVEFFTKYGGLEVDEEEGGFSGWSGAEYIRSHFQAAKAQPWWELKKQSPYKGFNLQEEMIKLIKRARAANDKLEDAQAQGIEDVIEKISIDPDMLASMEEMLRSKVA